MHIEDLKTGTYVVVTDKKYNPNRYIDYQPSDEFEPNGIPIRILAISLPFIVGTPVVAPNHLATIDISRYEIRKAESKYVKVWKNNYNLQLALANGTVKDGPIV